MTESTTGESLADYALFAGHVWFLLKHGTGKPDAYREWMRVLRNLIRNSRVERRDEFRVASRVIRELVCHANDILGYLQRTSKELDGDTLVAELDDLLISPSETAVPAN